MHALVIGLGISGKAAVSLLELQGYSVTGFDDRLSNLEIAWDGIDLVVVSPGVEPSHKLYQEALARQIPLIGEAELALSHLQGKQRMLGVTGTNGKTTVTLLLEHVLTMSGYPAKALGNVGIPLSAYALDPHQDEILVVELSSYQLETMVTPVFDGAVLLNITPDHLDRYGNMHAYALAKWRLQHLLKPSAPFFVERQVMEQFPLGTGVIREMDNVAAAWALAQVIGVKKEQFFAAVKSFKKPPHRIEWVRELNGVTFFDDSKGTNVDAVICAVASMKGPTILIVGGVDKGGSYLPWKSAFTGKVKRMLAIGEAAPKIIGELGNDFIVEHVDSLEDAIKKAHKHAVFGDCVLLSPGCSSYDMFRDYAHRGEVFQQTVMEIER